MLGVAGVCGVVVWGIVALVVAVFGGVVCCVLDFLLDGVCLLWSFWSCRWCLGFLVGFGVFFVLLLFPFCWPSCGDLRENL